MKFQFVKQMIACSGMFIKFELLYKIHLGLLITANERISSMQWHAITTPACLIWPITFSEAVLAHVWICDVPSWTFQFSGTKKNPSGRFRSDRSYPAFINVQILDNQTCELSVLVKVKFTNGKLYWNFIFNELRHRIRSALDIGIGTHLFLFPPWRRSTR